MACGFHSIVFSTPNDIFYKPDQPIMVRMQRLLQDLAFVYYQNYPKLDLEDEDFDGQEGAAAEPIRRADLHYKEEAIRRFCPKLEVMFLYAARLTGILKFGVKGSIFIDPICLFTDYIKSPKMKLVESAYIPQCIQVVQEMHYLDSQWNAIEDFDSLSLKLQHYRVPDEELTVSFAPNITLTATSHRGHLGFQGRKA